MRFSYKYYDQTIINNSKLMLIDEFHDCNVNTNHCMKNSFGNFTVLQINPNIFGSICNSTMG